MFLIEINRKEKVMNLHKFLEYCENGITFMSWQDDTGKYTHGDTTKIKNVCTTNNR